MAKHEKISAQRILTTVNGFYTDLWPLWMRERALISFYNGGLIPTDGEDNCGEPKVSLGLGYRYIKKPYENLIDAIIQEPGFIKTDLEFPVNVQRKSTIEGGCDKLINSFVQLRMESAIRKAAGRAVITGRAFFYRLSRWDWLYKTGRMLHALNDPDDVYSESFREWAFMGQISLREIDEHLEDTRDYEGAGWNYEGLKAIKEYILKTTNADKEQPTQEIEERMLRPLEQNIIRRPLDVYWYFRKNGEKAKDGREKIDLYCVSRWGQEQSIEKVTSDGGIVYKAMKVAHQGKGIEDQILYYLPDAFENIDEALIPALLDSRVDGEQELAQIDGVGKIMVPRLQFTEHIAMSIGEGVSFGVQPNWTSDTGTAIKEDEIKRIQREGLSSWDYLPPGLIPVKKDNAMTGINAAMEMLSMLGVSAEQDSGTGEINNNGAGQARFKAEASQLIAQTQNAAGRRTQRFNTALDLLANMQTKTFCRPIAQWNKGDAGYIEVKTFQQRMLQLYGAVPPEYEPERIKGKCRRLGIAGDRQQAAQMAQYTLQTAGQGMSPQGQRYFQKEFIRALWSDPVADMSFPDSPQEQPDQIKEAMQQSATALSTGVPPPRMLQDQPAVHAPIHFQILQQKAQALQQMGSQTPMEQHGMMALFQHTIADASGLPHPQQMQLKDPLMQIQHLIQTLPVSGAGSETALKEKKLQLDYQKRDDTVQREGHLQQDRERKLAQKDRNFSFEQWKFIKQLLHQKQKDGVSMAGDMLDMIERGAENSPQPQPESAAA